MGCSPWLAAMCWQCAVSALLPGSGSCILADEENQPKLTKQVMFAF